MSSRVASQFVLLFLAFNLACIQQKSEVSRKSFVLPFIVQKDITDTFSFYREKGIADAWPKFVGKYSFLDTLKLPVQPEWDTSYRKDFRFENYFNARDSLGHDGLELYVDYNASVARLEEYFDYKDCHYYYPLHLVNHTLTTKFFLGKDDHAFAIQEAEDGEGRWRPIEHEGFDFCGNGYWGLLIHPDEFITILLPKYKGDFKTRLRVRLVNDDVVYVSKPFYGEVDKNQFYLTAYSDRKLLEFIYKRPQLLYSIFYGSVPLELDLDQEE